jgi:phage protein D
MSTVASYLDTYAPRFFVEADGKLAEDIAEDIVKFEYDDDEKKPNEIKLTINNMGGKYTDDPRFIQGVTFRVRWGYANDLSPVYGVVIAKAKPRYPAPGQVPTIEMVAWDIQYSMNREAHALHWGKVSSSDIARKIAERYSLEADIEESNDARESSARVQPASVSDIQYLYSLATPLNWDCFIEGNRLHFHKKRLDAAPSLTFSYFNDPLGTLIEFTPEVSMGKPNNNKKAGADTKDGKGKDAKGDKESERKMGRFFTNMDVLHGQVGVAPKNDLFADKHYNPFGKFGFYIEGGALTSPTPEKDTTIIQKHADAVTQKIDMSCVEASIKVIGSPKVKARAIIKLENVSKTYSGEWRVKSSKHAIDTTGYVVTAKLTRNALDKGKTKAKTNDKPKNGDGNDPHAGTHFLDLAKPGESPVFVPKQPPIEPGGGFMPFPAKFQIK